MSFPRRGTRLVESDLAAPTARGRRFVAGGGDRYNAAMKFQLLVTLFLASILAGSGCLPPVDYKAENQFQNDLAAEHNDCVITARKACEGARVLEYDGGYALHPRHRFRVDASGLGRRRARSRWRRRAPTCQRTQSPSDRHQSRARWPSS